MLFQLNVPMLTMITETLALQRIQQIFRDQFLDDGLIVDSTSSPNTIEAWDSLAQVGLLAAIEAELDMQFTADEMGEISSVADILQCLRARGVVG
jgi:acyl carrier protein